MMTDVKDVNKLFDALYLLEKKQLVLMAANAMIDLEEMYIYEKLTEEKKRKLTDRVKNNTEVIRYFLNDKDSKWFSVDFSIHTVSK